VTISAQLERTSDCVTGAVMTIVSLLALSLLQPERPDTFSIRADLQGLYDEISQAMLQFVTEADVQEFHDVLYTPDWVFVDATGVRYSWQQVRPQAVELLKSPRAASIVQPIQKLTLQPNGAVVIVDVAVTRDIVDGDGRYGPRGASHSLTEITRFRDSWVKVSDKWKQTSREQVGKPRVLLDKTDH